MRKFHKFRVIIALLNSVHVTLDFDLNLHDCDILLMEERT